jgi:hypothetical protein
MTEPDPNESFSEEGGLARHWRVVALGVAGAMIVCFVFAGVKLGAPGVLLVLAGTALVATIALLWGSLRTLLGETRLSGADAYAIGAPRVEEEQKRAVLRALKDLEFERSVGKISEGDYKFLVTHYRKEAKRLLRLLDEASAEQRARAEAVVDARLRTAGLRREEPAPAPTKSEGTERPAKEGAADG